MKAAAIIIMILSGWASQYAPRVMGRVVDYRLRHGQITEGQVGLVDGYVARPSCSEIGDIVYLQPEGAAGFESFLVVDCGCPIGYRWMVNHNVLVEVDYETAERWNTLRRGIRVEMLTESQYRLLRAQDVSK